MKLLLDENLSDRIVYRIIDLYPSSNHVKTLALTNTDDSIIWEYAKANNFVNQKLYGFVAEISSETIVNRST